MKRLVILFLLFASYSASRAPHTIADIAGDGNVHQILTTTTLASMFQVMASPANTTTNCSSTAISACPRVGDASISSTQGIFLLPGAAQFFPITNSSVQGSPSYDLSKFYYLVPSGQGISIIWFD